MLYNRKYKQQYRAKLLYLRIATACCISLGLRAEIDFNREIRPILSENCYQCHGPDEETREGGTRESGGLRLDTRDGAIQDLGGYAAIVPHNPDVSEILYLITTDSDDDRMPPKKHGDPLRPGEIALLRKWIEEGADYDLHWSYQKPEKPTIPKIEDPGYVLNNAIDHFIADKLVTKSLRQSPPAGRYALARRAALDLTGLPPEKAWVDAFVEDTDPHAFERYVEVLLNGPAYGEHWARMWLDLARYADSAGYADDPLREMWGFRDYVIRSFNENKPFDQFTIEQIAGDLLPDPSIEQLVATAFHRNTKTNSEGGTVDEEFRNEAIVDRVNTTMAVWMGTTIDCAQCHTHKYDPITQEEYFQMFALFNNTADEDRKDEEPLIGLYSDSQIEERTRLENNIARAEKTLLAKLDSPQQEPRRRQWEAELLSESSWTTLEPLVDGMSARSGAVVKVGLDAIITIGDNSAPQDNYTVEATLPKNLGAIAGIRLEVFPFSGKNSNKNEPWVLNELDVRLLNKSQGEDGEGAQAKKPPKVQLGRASATFEQQWYEAADAIDDVTGDRFSGWATAGNIDRPNAVVFQVANRGELKGGDKVRFTLYHNFPNKKIRRFRLSVTDLKAPFPAVPQEMLPIFAKTENDRSTEEEAIALSFFAQHDPDSRNEIDQIEEWKLELQKMKPLTTVPILQAVPSGNQRETRMQYRGNYLDKGPVVDPGVPAIFHDFPASENPSRLSLAEWLVDEGNPLTARVVVNRYWEALFGRGIVATSEEFGSQGELPSHPELLDWLAVELMENDWDLKYLIRTMVSSATYQQSSKLTSELLEKDPDNRFLARGPRFRITAEMVRDQALAASGLLSNKMYGPSVKPPQPELGLKAAFGGETDWKPSNGEDRFRRGVYTSWRRSNPYPSMATFDAPNREFCSISRDRTNTPLQALVTLNDPVYVEASQALGRLMAEHTGDAVSKVAMGFQRCLARPPSEQETKTLIQLYLEMRERYQRDSKAAIAMASIPIGDLPEGIDAAEYAAWAVVGNALLNLDEMFLKL
jgi:hypothetical protein